MNVLKKCCFRSLRENKRRTVVTIIGVILATALITAVACMAVSCRASLIAYERMNNGDYNYWFHGVSREDLAIFRNNRHVEKIGIAEEVGYALLEGCQNPDKPYLYVRALDLEGFDAFSLKLKEGRLPQDAGEIVIGSHVRTNGLVKVQVGDTLVLQVGERVSEGLVLGQENPYRYEEEGLLRKEEKAYKVVGIVERPNYAMEERMAPGYSAFTFTECMDTAEDGRAPERTGTAEDGDAERNLDVFATYTKWGLKHDREVTAGILGVTEELYARYQESGMDGISEEEDTLLTQVADAFRENYWLNKWLKFRFSSGVMNALYCMAALAVLVIIVTSVFCIRNSFVISLTEKMKLYGRLASVGTTSRQQKGIVFYEAAFIGGVGIPLGVLSGLAATWVLISVVGGMVEDGMGIRLIFGTSPAAVAVAAILAAVTVYFSAAGSARKASRISPISAIRGNDVLKDPKRLSCPKFIKRAFGVGGTIAYKNLKRARVKYRTTVISIVVSVAVFIGLSTFVQLVGVGSGIYYKNMDYQLRAYLSGEDAYERAVGLTRLEGVKAAEIQRSGFLDVDNSEVPYTREYLDVTDPGETLYCAVFAIGEEGHRRYCEKLGIDPEQARDKAIVCAVYSETIRVDGKLTVNEGEIASYQPGDRIRGTWEVRPEDGTVTEGDVTGSEESGTVAEEGGKGPEDGTATEEDGTGPEDGTATEGDGTGPEDRTAKEEDGTGPEEDGARPQGGATGSGEPGNEMKSGRRMSAEIEVLLQTREKPMCLSDSSMNTLMLIVSDEWLENSGLLTKEESVRVYFQSDDPDELEAELLSAGVPNNYLSNYYASYRSSRNLNLVIAIFLYGFLAVVSLVGITNIFNTVATNMELRAPEFAMLRSMGMTGRQFRRMIWLEGLFYGGKALLLGIPLGILLSLGFHKAFGEGIVIGYRFPAGSILLAAAAVFLLLFVIMRYSVGKMNGRNVIETIRNENI